MSGQAPSKQPATNNQQASNEQELNIKEVNKQQMNLMIKYLYKSINDHIEKQINDSKKYIDKEQQLHDALFNYEDIVRVLNNFHKTTERILLNKDI